MLRKTHERAFRRRDALRLVTLGIFLLGMATLLPTSTGFSSRVAGDVKIIGQEEVVYDASAERCAERDIPDTPARAFRAADGRVQLITGDGAGGNRRMIGETLDSVEHECHVVLESDRDIDPSQYSWKDWLSSVYTLDGETIYGLVHMEYLGHEASRWYAERDFSSIPGKGQWFYQEWNGATYTNMQFDGHHDQWRGSQQGCFISPNAMYPVRSCEPARKWVSPVTDTVTVSGDVRDIQSQGGDGVVVRILKNREELWSKNIANGDVQGDYFNLEVSVQAGDALYFRVNQKRNPHYDATYFNPKINLGPDPCPSGQRRQCQLSAITFAQSTDMGRTYTQPKAPNHLVAAVPYRYQPDLGALGIWQQSDIVHNPDDGYYYAAIHAEVVDVRDSVLQQRGTCMMRTKDLADPTSWRAWDGKGFNVRFVSSYANPELDPAKHVCEPVSREAIGVLTYNLTYNSYYDKFMLVGHHNAPIRGVYYSLSNDLINWTPQRLLMATDHNVFPSLIDPTDHSRNFEVTGQRPYLYFRHINGHLDIDLMRVQVEFNK